MRQPWAWALLLFMIGGAAAKKEGKANSRQPKEGSPLGTCLDRQFLCHSAFGAAIFERQHGQ